jgi:transcriptional regulator with XRE-family HTH domain
MNLFDFLAQELKKTSSRELAAKIGVSHTTIRSMAQGELKALPEVETLIKIAKAFDLPLWRVIEMAGVDLGLPEEDSTDVRRIASLANHQERFLEVATLLAKTDQAEIEMVARFLAGQQVSDRVYETVRLLRHGMTNVVGMFLQLAEQFDVPVTGRHVYLGERFKPTQAYQSPVLADGVTPRNMLLRNVSVDGKFLSEEVGLGMLPDFDWGSAGTGAATLAKAIFAYEFRDAVSVDLQRYAEHFAQDVIATLPHDVGGIEWMLESQEIVLWLTIVKVCEQVLGKSLVSQA